MRIAIIGTGISALRAGLVLCPDHDVTLFEKSSGVGGRVSTRRVENSFINHGAPKFDRYEELLKSDSLAEKYQSHFSFQGAATDLPKAMRNDLLDRGAKLMLNTEVTHVEDGKLVLADKNVIKFEAILLTAPLPQTRKLLGGEILPHIDYTKVVRFIGLQNGKPFIEDISPELAEEIFELSDEEIRDRCRVPPELMIKKWRYARVKTGCAKFFCKITSRMLVAGDAFDPEGHYDLTSAWISGMRAGMFLN